MTPLQRIELDMLEQMIANAEASCEWAPDELLQPFKLFEGYDREVVRGVVRSMAARGLLKFGHGFTSEGMTAGSGYCMTRAGLDYHDKLKGAE